jgi:hypothetical protein
MALTNTERQTAFKKRMYEAGYKQKQVWVPRDEEESKKIKMSWKAFIRKLEELTAGWSQTRLSGLFERLLKAVKSEAREGEEKEKA